MSDSKKKKKDKNTKKKTIITIEEEILGPFTVNYVIKRSVKHHDHDHHNNKPKVEDSRTKEEKEKEELDVKALESIRRKAIEELKSKNTTSKEKIDAGWRLLHSFGFERNNNELQKSSKWWLGGGF